MPWIQWRGPTSMNSPGGGAIQRCFSKYSTEVQYMIPEHMERSSWGPSTFFEENVCSTGQPSVKWLSTEGICDLDVKVTTSRLAVCNWFFKGNLNVELERANWFVDVASARCQLTGQYLEQGHQYSWARCISLCVRSIPVVRITGRFYDSCSQKKKKKGSQPYSY